MGLDLDFFAPMMCLLICLKYFPIRVFFPWKSLSALEDFIPVYRSHHPKVMVMRDQLGVSLWGRLHCTLSTSLYCNCTTWSYANQSCIPRCKLNSKDIKYYTYNAHLPDHWSHLVSCWQWPHYIRCSINTITCIDCFLCALWYSGTAACNFRICRLFHVPCWFYVYVHFCDECNCLCIWYALCMLIEALIACVVLIAGCSN